VKIENINVNETLEKVKTALKANKQIANSTKIIFEILILLVGLLVNRLGLTSKNSSKPPSTDIGNSKK
jgi:hypothetical protein